jgi:inosose dehydratase
VGDKAFQVKLGCQTYTWKMLSETWKGGPDDLLDAIASAGYAGIEITDNMIGPDAADPAAFASALDDRGPALVAYAVASPTGFTNRRVLDEGISGGHRSALNQLNS